MSGHSTLPGFCLHCLRAPYRHAGRGLCETCWRRHWKSGHLDTYPPLGQRHDMHRFWACVGVGPGCWEWTAGTNRGGYGNFRLGGRRMNASKASWLLNVGPVPRGAQVNHHCDNAKCVRPGHLYLGTQSENIMDMLRRERKRRGLTASKVQQIRARHPSEGTRRLATEMGVSMTCIQRIISGHSWSWLDALDEEEA